MTKRTFGLLTALIVLGSVAVVGMNQWRSASASAIVDLQEANFPLPVTTLTAERVDSYPRERHYTGLLRELRRSQLSFQRGGEVVELLVDEGDAVEAGQVLGRLDARHIRAAQARLTAQVGEAKAVLAELLAGPRKETIAAKRAELRAQQSQVKVLEGQLARRRQLVRSGSVTQEEYETFLFDTQSAQARTEVVARQLEELVAGTRVEQISAQRARLAQLDAQLTDIVHDLEDTTLLAPFAGRISRRMVDEGTVLSAGAPVLELIDDTQLEAWIGMPQLSATALRLGDQYELEVEGQTIRATLHSLGPDVDQTTRTRNAILRLHAAQQIVVPGQVVRLPVSESVAESGYWVPTTALARGTRGLWSLYVVDEKGGRQVIARRDVELLDTVGERSFVRGTLQPGEQIVADGAHRVVVGQRVTLSGEKLAQKSF
ncbi:MAG: efflux RND transporter periplasmic adaptor subunit [Pirellulales bacterium]|nr:efflux RND transporter periplasmic adaptor subunit [Pirellulales bacterium]